MSAPRHIVLDIDGTLFSSEVALDPRLPEVLRDLRRAGVRVSLLSGRMPQSMLAVVRSLELGSDGVHGGGDGAVIWRPVGTLSYDVVDAPELTLPRPYPFESPGLALGIDGIWMVGELSEHMRYLAFITDPRTREVSGWNEVDDSLGPIVGLRFLLDRPEAMEVVRILGAHEEHGTIDLFDNGEFGMDVVGIAFRPKGRDKGTGVERICELVGVPSSETVAFGDWVTDIPMFERVGMSVVPADSLPQVTERATRVSRWTLRDGWIVRELAELYPEIVKIS